MATCPKCLQDKPLMAEYCHNCMQRVGAKDQFAFSGIISILYWMAVFWVVVTVIGWLN